MTSKSINANVLTSTGKIDSLAAPDGSQKIAVIRSDQFESGVDAAFWSNSDNVAAYSLVSTPMDGNTSNKVSFYFPGSAAYPQNTKQAPFTFPQTFEHVLIEYDLYVPANYSHINSGLHGASNNNKIFRLYQNSYSDVTKKIGASVDPNNAGDGGSKLYVEAVGSGGSGTGRRGIEADDFITLADRDSWIRVKIEVLAPTVGANIDINTGNGSVHIYKNSVLKAYATNIPSSVSGDQGYNKGYMMGAANSGFLTDTTLAIDNIVFRGE